MITRIVITRASVPHLVAIASPSPSRGTRTGILGNLASSSSSSSSSSRVPCPSPASVNSHCHRNPTQSRILKTHYPRPSSSSSSSPSWSRMTRAQPTSTRARAHTAHERCIRTFDEVYRSSHTHGWMDVHTRKYIYSTLARVYMCFPYPSVRTHTPRRASQSCSSGQGDIGRSIGPTRIASGSRIHQSRLESTHRTREPVVRVTQGWFFFAREVVIVVVVTTTTCTPRRAPTPTTTPTTTPTSRDE